MAHDHSYIALGHSDVISPPEQNGSPSSRNLSSPVTQTDRLTTPPPPTSTMEDGTPPKDMIVAPQTSTELSDLSPRGMKETSPQSDAKEGSTAEQSSADPHAEKEPSPQAEIEGTKGREISEAAPQEAMEPGPQTEKEPAPQTEAEKSKSREGDAKQKESRRCVLCPVEGDAECSVS